MNVAYTETGRVHVVKDNLHPAYVVTVCGFRLPRRKTFEAAGAKVTCKRCRS